MYCGTKAVRAEKLGSVKHQPRSRSHFTGTCRDPMFTAARAASSALLRPGQARRGQHVAALAAGTGALSSASDGGGGVAFLPQFWTESLLKVVTSGVGSFSAAALKSATVWRISALSGDSADGIDEIQSSTQGMKDGNGASNGNGPPAESKGLKLASGAFMLPHPDKVERGGEDSYFILDSGVAAGVADGVGGWAEVGIDAGAYARLLMKNCARFAEGEEVISQASPLRILKQAYLGTKVQGSSTACLIAMGDDTVHAANLGDSGFIIVRGQRIIFKSPQQQHDFNFPFQLGSEQGMSDAPEAASIFSVPVLEGDIIVMGTDGLFDNVFTDEIAHLAAVNKAGGSDPIASAKSIGTLAHVAAKDSEMMSPFGMAAQQVGFMYKGGKMDDITVVVSYVEGASGGEDSPSCRARGGFVNPNIP
eukprot:CAMPEP_0177793430 /NCGR_PEP_ID=MMETSP0491_2-20121128/25069_1 /TAXON_ID=63592 /ORGANISM="Tetraselmis chuii, Strain PLY429" /LENGTH=420 /DNA_ID=CAMNT_0019315941 /DNA_START=149 /DNA_END=1411 /DNA_ORIENTATION=+